MTIRIGIMGAMDEEVRGFLQAMPHLPTPEKIGGRDYYRGHFGTVETVTVFSRWGKVAAASTATTLITHFNVSALVFSGVAGGVDRRLHVGDIVVADQLVQHDLNASPLFPALEIPLLGLSRIRPSEGLKTALLSAASQFLGGKGRVHYGTIASGDQFFSSEEQLEALRARVPDVLCVEMEGAAVAQVCHEHSIPFAVVRTISDSADEGAPQDFMRFIAEVAAPHSAGILKNLLAQNLQQILSRK